MGNKLLMIFSQFRAGREIHNFNIRSRSYKFDNMQKQSAHAVNRLTCGSLFSIRIGSLAFRQLMTTDDAGATTGSKSELICIEDNAYIRGHS